MVKIKDLYFSYDNRHEALRGVSLNIEKGSWTAIVGHNGSGKSTLAKLLVGLIKPTKGEIYINDILMKEENIKEIRKHVGIVFQNPDNQFVGVTVKHDIAFGLENQQVPQEEMIKLIDKYIKVVNMEGYLDKEPHQLSGGEKQRVAIAGALAMNQDIMIFDEATSMLDPQGTKEISDFILELNDKYDKTLITITHDLEFARKADNIVVLNDGAVIFLGTPDEVFKNSDILKRINLDIPFGLKIYETAKEDIELKDNKKLMDALWQYSLKM
ncbi:MAG: energy-coupling factor transporter ATPase [Acholeplasmataceae bacterium]|nr:energy-coupling factor transporter ATPase [Acholeplasmataceae bacterium]